MKSEEYLKEIREIPGLERAVLRKITVEGGEALFHLVTDVNYTPEAVTRAGEVSARYAGGLKAQARVIKSVPSEEAVKIAVVRFLSSKFPAFASFTDPDNIRVTVTGKGGTYSIVTAGEGTDEVTDAVSAMLGRSFCGTWVGKIESVAQEPEAIERELPPEEYIYAPRTFKIVQYSPIDGGDPATAVYIADLTKEMQGVTVCGAITHIEERSTKNGKPYFSVTVGDGTGTLRAAYFTKKATLEKVRSLREGTSVCLTGDNEFYNGGLSFRIKAIDYGEPPAGFVPKTRPARPIPAQYRAVFPTPEADLVQADLFGGKHLPEQFLKEKFVVFDLETTGLSQGGFMDRIIEIGAVKIEGGSIVEKFSTFVACPVRIPAEIVEITHITDDMLVGAPELESVLADFYKFTAGCSLVAHNTQFDCRLIRYYGEPLGYPFDMKQYDTMLIAPETVRLKNYKLNTIADHFGFTFNHHRAFDDAFVTAKIFIELIRMRGSLPQ